MADYPGTLPDFVALVPNPQSHAQAVDFADECQAVVDTLGTNPQGTYGTVDARLDALEATLQVAANTGFRNVRVYNDWTTPTTKLVVLADVLAIEGALQSSLAVTLDLTATGKNGMANGRAVSTWYYVWIGHNPVTNEVCVMADTESDRGVINDGHATLDGFTQWRRVSAFRTNATGSGELVRFFQHDSFLLYDAVQAAAAGASATAGTWYTRAVDVAVPPTSRNALIQCSQFNGTAAQTTTVSMVGIDVGRPIVYGVGLLGNDWVTLTAAREFRWKCNETVGSNSIFFGVVGYHHAL